MITIEQLLESVVLDFEPGWITQDKVGYVCIWENKPERCDDIYHVDVYNVGKVATCPKLKLAEFKNKPWQECIYEVPRKTDEYEQNLEKLRPADSDLVYRVNLPRKTTGKIEKLEPELMQYTFDEKEYETLKMPSLENFMDKVNELVDAVNELKENKGV